MVESRSVGIVCLVLVLSVFLSVPLAFADRAEADSAMVSAEEEIVVCFEAAAEAEELGADISSLTVVLNDASLLLSRSRVVYGEGDFEVARELAVQSRARLVGFEAATDALVVSAVNRRVVGASIGVFGSAVATVIVLGAGWFVWGFLKRQHLREVLGSKPVLEE